MNNDFIKVVKDIRLPTKHFVEAMAWLTLLAAILAGCAAVVAIPGIRVAGRLGIAAGILACASLIFAVVSSNMRYR